MAASTRAAVAALTPRSPFTTRETVLTLTAAVVATSRIVGLAILLRPSCNLALTTMSSAMARTLTPDDNVGKTGDVQLGRRVGSVELRPRPAGERRRPTARPARGRS